MTFKERWCYDTVGDGVDIRGVILCFKMCLCSDVVYLADYMVTVFSACVLTERLQYLLSVKLNMQHGVRFLMLQGLGRELEGCRSLALNSHFLTVVGRERSTPLASGWVTFVQNNQWPLCCGVQPGDAALELPLSTESSEVTSAVVKT